MLCDLPSCSYSTLLTALSFASSATVPFWLPPFSPNLVSQGLYLSKIEQRPMAALLALTYQPANPTPAFQIACRKKKGLGSV
jgi:hypothetical protein